MAQGIKYQLNLNAEIENLNKLKEQLKSLESEKINLKIDVQGLNKDAQSFLKQATALQKQIEKQARESNKRMLKDEAEVIKKTTVANKKKYEKMSADAQKAINEVIEAQKKLNKLQVQEAKFETSGNKPEQLAWAKQERQEAEEILLAKQQELNVDKESIEYQQLNNKLLEMEKETQKEINKLQAVSKDTEMKKSNDFADNMKKATGAVLGLGSASMAVMTLTQAMTALIQTSYELNKQMTQLAMITGKTSSEMDALASSYTQMAMDLGATTSQIMSAADEFLLIRASI